MLLTESMSSCYHERPRWSPRWTEGVQRSEPCEAHGSFDSSCTGQLPYYDRRRTESFLEICKEEFEILGKFFIEGFNYHT